MKRYMLLILAILASGMIMAGEASLEDMLAQLGDNTSSVRGKAKNDLTRVLKGNEETHLNLLSTLELEKGGDRFEASCKRLLGPLEYCEKALRTTTDPELKTSLADILSQVSPSTVFKQSIGMQVLYVTDAKVSPNWRFRAYDKDDKIDGCILANMYHYPRDRWDPSEGKTPSVLVVEIGDLRLIFLNYKKLGIFGWGMDRIALTSSEGYGIDINKAVVRIDNYMYGDEYCSVKVLGVPFKIKDAVFSINRKKRSKAEAAVRIKIDYPKAVETVKKPKETLGMASEIVEKWFLPCDIKNVLVFSDKGTFLTHIVPPVQKVNATQIKPWEAVDD